MSTISLTVSDTTLRRFHRAQLTVYAILAASYMLVFFHRVAPAVVSDELMRAFNTTAASLGSLASMYYYVYVAMQIPAGVLADTLGVRIAAGTAMAVAGIGSVLFGLAPDFTVAAIGRLLVGLGVSVVFIGLMRANTMWWSESRFGFISGLTMFLGNLGAVIGAAPLAALVAYVSWRNVFVIVGIINIVIALLTFAFVRNRPEDAGLPSPRQLDGKPALAPRSQPWWRDLYEVLRNRAVWPGFWVNLGMTGGMLAFSGLWGVPLLRDIYGLTRSEAALYTTATLAALAVGSLFFGWFSDRIRRRKVVIVGCTFASLAIWLALLLAPWGPGWSGFVLYALLGFADGGFIVLFGTAKEVTRPSTAGMAISVVTLGVFLGAALIQPLFGWLLDLTWTGTVVDGVRHYGASDYRNGLWLCCGLTLLSALASLRVRETYCRNITG